jgi:transcriptional regulator with XRE-family HTH domain
MSSLGKNIGILRKNRDLSQKTLAEDLGIPRTTLSGYERGNSEPDIELIIKIAEYFKVDVDALLRLNLEGMSSEDLIEKSMRVVTVTQDKSGKANIQLVDTKAEAGYLESFNDPEYIKDLPTIQLPQLSGGNYRAFEINGDSMLPMEPGSIVIASYVEKLSDVKDGKTYVVASKDGLVYKRIRRMEDKDAFVLISDNELYAPYEIAFDDIQELWQYYAHLSFTDGKSTFDTLLDDRWEDMHTKIDGIYKKYVRNNL